MNTQHIITTYIERHNEYDIMLYYDLNNDASVSRDLTVMVIVYVLFAGIG